jgi:hypothetical protein
MLNAGHGNDAQVILDRYTGSADQVGLTGTLAMVATLLVSYIDRISPVLAAAKPDYPHASGDDALTLFESLMSQATDSGEPSRAEPISYL